MGRGVSQGDGSIPTLAFRVLPLDSIHRLRFDWHAVHDPCRCIGIVTPRLRNDRSELYHYASPLHQRVQFHAGWDSVYHFRVVPRPAFVLPAFEDSP